MNDFNAKLIEEFRENGGKVGGMFEKSSLLLLHHKGAKSGVERISPLAYRKVGDAYAVFGSKGGGPTNPDWYHNVQANPRTKVEVGSETIDVVARVASGDERDRIWEDQKRAITAFADYETKTDRQIPVVILDPA
ncbi:MAG: nitroreductase family deazaflavin-dependent oxidoreductase [Actinobacteria bacterium]|nr:MAG: nitroreductase family deazaflavin-dependent oxidoreductase [Actinomycetota bacterium]